MKPAANPFTDPDLVGGDLYASADRLARRSAALHRARVAGRHAGEVIADLAAAAVEPGTPALVADLGCGRGTTAGLMAARIPSAAVVAVDLSAAMLTVVRDRLTPSRLTAVVRADFHHLPFRDGACDVIVAAFCLYHSSCPATVIGEIARCLRPEGIAIFAVKSRESYRELDQLVAASGLDPAAVSRPSLYETVHSGNLAGLVGGYLSVQQVIHHSHTFTFGTLDEVAEYLSTSPKYQLPACVVGDPAVLAAALRQRFPKQPVTTSSVVTYVTATRSS